ncbi:LysM peptidoglycan-binding domain-containing protein [Lutibacter holmesii]|uniref:LysM peptidoglycan-binding domain-containing protein n=1 Tax=Lutibacter holmesii TaxID=1137985 RepID=A0ABW3WN97_9FLAO
MKQIKILTLVLLFFSVITIAQEKKYVSYEVQKGETLKSIAKNYNLSTKDLARLNPGVSRKPVLGTVIIVPNKNYGKTTTVVKTEGDFYKVKPQETLYGISKKHGITVEELTVANPALKDGLKIGMELTIPKPSVTQAKDTVNYVLHKVIKDDTVFSIKKQYEVTDEDLLQLNPSLKDGLKLGMLLKIKPVVIKEESDNTTEEMTEIPTDSLVVFQENLNLSKKLKVALILPYQLSKLNDSIALKSFDKSNSLLNIATDFHLGAQMAIDSLKEKGLDIDVSYFDSEKSNQKIQSLLNNNQNFNTTDLIVGPLFLKSAHLVSKKTNAYVLAPFQSKKQDELNAPNFIKSGPNSIAHQNKLLAHMEATYKGENILVINDGKEETQTQLWQMVNKIKTFDSIQTVTVIKPEKGYINRDKFLTKLDSLSNNWVVLISDENVTTSTTVNNLKGFAERIQINLFALNKGKNFKNIDNSFLGKLKFTYPTAEFLNTEKPEITQFYNSFKQKNAAFPSKYAIRGFEVTYDALVRLASSEINDEGLTTGQSERIFSKFNYSKNTFGSFENEGLFLIQYNEDLTTTIIE